MTYTDSWRNLGRLNTTGFTQLITFNGNLVLCPAGYGPVYSSSDGTDWQEKAYWTNTNGVFFSDDNYIYFADEDRVLRTEDFSNWEELTTDTPWHGSLYYSSALYFKGALVIFTNHRVYCSWDGGKNWKSTNSWDFEKLPVVCADANYMYRCFGPWNDYAEHLYTIQRSSDAVNWYDYSSLPYSSEQSVGMCHLVYDGRYFHLLGGYDFLSYNHVLRSHYISEDCKTWTQLLDYTTGSYSRRSVALDGHVYVYNMDCDMLRWPASLTVGGSYASTTADTMLTMHEGITEFKSLEIGVPETSDLATKLRVEYRTNYFSSENEKLVLNADTKILGTRTKSYTFSTKTNKESIEYSAGYMLSQMCVAWKRVKCKVFLYGVHLELFDWVYLNYSRFLLSGIFGRVIEIVYDTDNRSIELTIETACPSGKNNNDSTYWGE